jgi:hypothetical protein
MTTMLIDNRRDRSTMFTQLVICCLVALAGIVGYLYSTTLGVNYTRERDNIGNTYCLYWTPPFSTFETSFEDEGNAGSCPYLAKPAQRPGA